MKSLGENKKVAGLLIALLIFLIGFALYMYILLPMKEEKNSLQYQISDMQSQIKDSKKQLKNMKSNQQASQKSNSELKTEVPTNRELSSLINSIEQVESVSKTNVVDIAFNNYDAVVKETINTDPTNGQATNVTNQNQTTDPTQTATQNTYSTKLIRQQMLDKQQHLGKLNKIKQVQKIMHLFHQLPLVVCQIH